MGARIPVRDDVQPADGGNLTGEVARIDKFTPMRGMSAGIHLLVKTGKETISVHRGPAGYIESQELQFAAGDKVEVTGSRITVEGQPAIIAAAVKREIKC